MTLRLIVENAEPKRVGAARVQQVGPTGLLLPFGVDRLLMHGERVYVDVSDAMTLRVLETPRGEIDRVRQLHVRRAELLRELERVTRDMSGAGAAAADPADPLLPLRS